MALVIGGNDPCQQVTTSWGQLLIFITFLINIYFQRRDKSALEKKTEETAEKLAVKTDTALKSQTKELKTSLEEQTKEIALAARTRLTDLGTQFDRLLTERPAQKAKR